MILSARTSAEAAKRSTAPSRFAMQFADEERRRKQREACAAFSMQSELDADERTASLQQKQYQLHATGSRGNDLNAPPLQDNSSGERERLRKEQQMEQCRRMMANNGSGTGSVFDNPVGSAPPGPAPPPGLAPPSPHLAPSPHLSCSAAPITSYEEEDEE